MSNTLEARLRRKAKERPGLEAIVFPAEIVELIDAAHATGRAEGAAVVEAVIGVLSDNATPEWWAWVEREKTGQPGLHATVKHWLELRDALAAVDAAKERGE